MEEVQPGPGSLSWRLSSHPITLLTFLAFRTCELRASSQRLSSWYKRSIPPHLSPRNSVHTQLVLYPPAVSHHTMLIAEQCHSIHHHNTPSRSRFLLPQEHRRSSSSRSTMVEWSKPREWSLTLGFWILWPKYQEHQCDWLAIFLVGALCAAAAMGCTCDFCYHPVSLYLADTCW